MMHKMILAFTKDEVERWICNECEREIDIIWEPYKRIVIVEGNTDAYHSGSKGGLTIGKFEVEQNE